MTTVNQVLKGALRKIGAIDPGKDPTAGESVDAMNVLNRMLYMWSADRNSVHKIVTESFTLTASTAEYTYGSGGDFDSARPIEILRGWIRDSNNLDFDLIETSFENYARIGEKDFEDRPDVFLFNAEFPKAKVTFYPVPDSAETVYFQAWKPLGQYSDIGSDLALPPEYEEAIEWNLAMRLAPEWIGETPQTVAMLAEQSYKKLKRLHAGPAPQIRTSLGGEREGRYNIYQDDY